MLDRTTGPTISRNGNFITVAYRNFVVTRGYPSSEAAQAAFAALTARFHAAWMSVVAEEVTDGLYEQETAREGE